MEETETTKSRMPKIEILLIIKIYLENILLFLLLKLSQV